MQNSPIMIIGLYLSICFHSLWLQFKWHWFPEVSAKLQTSIRGALGSCLHLILPFLKTWFFTLLLVIILVPFLSSSLDCQLYGQETPCLFYLPMFYAKAYHSAQNTQMLGKYLLNTWILHWKQNVWWEKFWNWKIWFPIPVLTLIDCVGLVTYIL